MLGIIGAGLGVIQTILWGKIFGTGDAIEVFFAATLLQQVIINLTASGQLGTLFTPIYHKLKNESGAEIATTAFRIVTTWVTLASIVLAFACGLSVSYLPSLIAPGFSHEQLELCKAVIKFTIPLIIFNCISSMLSTVLRADHKYGVPEFIGLLSRGINILILIFFAQKYGIWALVVGLWISTILLFLGQTFAVLKTRSISTVMPILYSDSFNPKVLFWQLPVTSTHLIASQFLNIALSAGLSSLPRGSYAVYNYAWNIQNKVRPILLRPTAIVHFNKLSDAITKKQEDLQNLAKESMEIITALSTFAIVIFWGVGNEILTLLIGGAKFPTKAIEQTNYLLIGLLAVLFVMAQNTLYRNTNISAGKVYYQYSIMTLATTLGGLLCYLLIPAFGLWGAWIVLITTQLIACCLSGWVTYKYAPQLFSVANSKTTLKWSVAGASGATIIFCLKSFLGWFGDISMAAWSLAAATGLLVTFFTAWFLKCESILALVKTAKQKIGH